MNGVALKKFWHGIAALRIRFIRFSFFVQRSKYLSVGREIEIYGNFVCHAPQNVEIGNKVSINDYVYINGAGGVRIGDNVALSTGCKLISTQLNSEVFASKREYISAMIYVGSNVQVGAGAIILPGVSVCDDVIIGAGSIVSKSIKLPGIYVGIPASCIKGFNIK